MKIFIRIVATIILFSACVIAVFGWYLYQNPSPREIECQRQMNQILTDAKPLQDIADKMQKLWTDAILSNDVASERIIRPGAEEAYATVKPYNDQWEQLYDESKEIAISRKTSAIHYFVFSGIEVLVAGTLCLLALIRLPVFNVTIVNSNPVQSPASEYVSQHCQFCNGGIEFSRHAIGSQIHCHHCGKTLTLKTSLSY